MEEEKLLSQLEEADLLRLQLLNRDMDLYLTQQELIQTKIKETRQRMESFSIRMKEKYELNDGDQLDPTTGVIVRNEGTPNGSAG